MENSKKTFKVIVTGFGPFGNVKENESWQAVSGLWEEILPSYIKLITRELPVVYNIAKAEVEKLWREEQPDLIIHVGVSVGDTKISLEKCSFNLNYVDEDVENKCPTDGICYINAPETLSTHLDVEKLCHISNNTFTKCNASGKCGPSEDPGRYLCGFTYFVSLYHDSKKSLFVHVPSRETIPIKEMTIALKSIIIESLNQLYGELIEKLDQAKSDDNVLVTSL